MGAGSGVEVPACTNGIASFWVVASAPDDRAATVEWSMLGSGTVLDAAVADAEVTSVVTDDVEVADDPVGLGSVALSTTDQPALHLARAVTAAASPELARTPRVRVLGEDRADPAVLTVLAGPCPPLTCPRSVDLELVPTDGPHQPGVAPVIAHAEVLHLVAPR